MELKITHIAWAKGRDYVTTRVAAVSAPRVVILGIQQNLKGYYERKRLLER